jgi:hypothetical protein
MSSRDLIVLLGAIAAAIIVLPLAAMSMGGFMMMGWMGGFGLLTWLLLIVGLVMVITSLSRKDRPPDDLLTILKRRLAAGRSRKTSTKSSA